MRDPQTADETIRELKARIRELESQLRHAQRMETLGTLAAGIVHDFNNLLMGIAGAARSAWRDLDSSHPAAPLLDCILGTSLRGASLARQLQTFGDRRRPALGPIELDDAVAKGELALTRLIGDLIVLTFEPGAPGGRVSADPGDIEQILMNLAMNARDAMPEGGELVIRTSLHASAPALPDRPDRRDYVAITVQDTGCGMDETTKARALEPFFTTKERGHGTGLGLVTVNNVVQQLGGRMALESTVGRGTNVTVFLPLANDPSAATGGRERAPPRGQGTVLVTEDDPLVARAVESLLQDLGYQPLLALHPEEAFNIAQHHADRIDVILADAMMRGCRSRSLAAELLTSLRGVPVLFMSAYPREDLVRSGRLAPEDRLLEKPFDDKALGTALRDTLASSAAEPGPVPDAARILIVHDDPIMAAALREIVGGGARRVETASSGEEALQLVTALHPDLVVCNLELPGAMTAFDLARALRAHDRAWDAFLVAIASIDSAERGALAREAGFDEVMAKPVDLERLARLIDDRTRQGR